MSDNRNLTDILTDIDRTLAALRELIAEYEVRKLRQDIDVARGAA